jgi:hypothetical protein
MRPTQTRHFSCSTTVSSRGVTRLRPYNSAACMRRQGERRAELSPLARPGATATQYADDRGQPRPSVPNASACTSVSTPSVSSTDTDGASASAHAAFHAAPGHVDFVNVAEPSSALDSGNIASKSLFAYTVQLPSVATAATTPPLGPSHASLYRKHGAAAQVPALPPVADRAQPGRAKAQFTTTTATATPIARAACESVDVHSQAVAEACEHDSDCDIIVAPPRRPSSDSDLRGVLRTRGAVPGETPTARHSSMTPQHVSFSPLPPTLAGRANDVCNVASGTSKQPNQESESPQHVCTSASAPAAPMTRDRHRYLEQCGALPEALRSPGWAADVANVGAHVPGNRRSSSAHSGMRVPPAAHVPEPPQSCQEGMQAQGTTSQSNTSRRQNSVAQSTTAATPRARPKSEQNSPFAYVHGVAPRIDYSPAPTRLRSAGNKATAAARREDGLRQPQHATMSDSQSETGTKSSVESGNMRSCGTDSSPPDTQSDDGAHESSHCPAQTRRTHSASGDCANTEVRRRARVHRRAALAIRTAAVHAQTLASVASMDGTASTAAAVSGLTPRQHNTTAALLEAPSALEDQQSAAQSTAAVQVEPAAAPMPTPGLHTTSMHAHGWDMNATMQVQTWARHAQLNAAMNELAAIDYNRYHRIGGLCSAILTGIVGASGIAQISQSTSASWVGNVMSACAILLAIISNVLTNMEWKAKSAILSKRSAAWSSLATELRVQLIQPPGSRQSVQTVLTSFPTRLQELNELAEPLPEHYRERAEQRTQRSAGAMWAASQRILPSSAFSSNLGASAVAGSGSDTGSATTTTTTTANNMSADVNLHKLVHMRSHTRSHARSHAHARTPAHDLSHSLVDGLAGQTAAITPRTSRQQPPVMVTSATPSDTRFRKGKEDVYRAASREEGQGRGLADHRLLAASATPAIRSSRGRSIARVTKSRLGHKAAPQEAALAAHMQTDGRNGDEALGRRRLGQHGVPFTTPSPASARTNAANVATSDSQGSDTSGGPVSVTSATSSLSASTCSTPSPFNSAA